MVKLSDPITIRGMKVKNRLAYPPMLSGSCDRQGRPTDRAYRAYERKAIGGVGLMIYEATMVDPHFPSENGARIGTDDNIPAYRKMTDLIHKHNVKFGMQINKQGLISYALYAMYNYFGLDPIGPSEIDLLESTSSLEVMAPAWPSIIEKNNLKMRELSIEEISNIQDLYAAGAKRAIQAGFDFVEIHSGHGTLPSAFLSKFNNRRTDKYGGSIEKRCQFILETVDKIRKSIGDDPPIFVRFSGDELFDGGNKIEDTTKIAQILEKGGVDCLDVSQGIILRTPYGIEIPTYCRHGCYIDLAEEIKKVVNIPVIGVGRIVDPVMADQFIQQEKADIIHMGRQLICDAETPNKYFNGQLDDIRYCIGCSQSCGTVCLQDAFSGQNYQDITPSAELKKIVIFGAGIAGMEAARVAKLRGHEVEIYEKSSKIGGLMPLVAAEYKKEEFMNTVKYLDIQLKKLKVSIHLNKELTREELTSLNPDILVIATGSEATVPEKFKGNPNVLTQDEAILKDKRLGKNIVVWGLNAYWRGGSETAITLAKEGYNVKALVGPEALIAQVIAGGGTGRRFLITQYLKENNIQVYSIAKLLDVNEKGVKFRDKERIEQFIEADTLVYCGSRISNGKKLRTDFEGVAPEIVLIGDCKKPRDIKEALKDAQTFARNLK